MSMTDPPQTSPAYGAPMTFWAVHIGTGVCAWAAGTSVRLHATS